MRIGNQSNNFFPFRVTYISSVTTLPNKICIPEVEESAFALPDELLRSLLSRPIEAEDVIARLLNMFHLEWESLAMNPQPRTRHLLRMLARVAKDMNRLDVFDFLRKIAPAGTTGNCFFMQRVFNQPFILLILGDNFCV